MLSKVQNVQEMILIRTPVASDVNRNHPHTTKQKIIRTLSKISSTAKWINRFVKEHGNLKKDSLGPFSGKHVGIRQLP